MNFISQVLHANYGNFFQNIREVAKKEKKNSVLLTLDVCFSTVVFGSALTDYFNYEFYNKSLKERGKYAVVHTQDKFYQLVNDPKYKQTFSVKPNFLKEFSQYVGREWIYPDGKNYDAYEAFLSRHDTFIVKPIDGLGGGGIYKAARGEIGDPKEFYQKLIAERMLLEEVIRQCDAMASLNPSSVNSIRVMTHNIDDCPTIFYSAVRIGNGGNVVDNFHSGGMGVTVDCDTGVLKGAALDKSMHRFERHPVTGTAFDGFQIPYWEEVKQMICAACRLHPEMTVIGWDVAVTDNGPILIEGNRRPGFDMVQMLDNHGAKHILKEIKARFLASKKRSAAE